jgi:AcrR family transcriptional regulator
MPIRSRPKAGYHHGDLKEAVRKTAVALIIERREVDFSLREIAALTHVSHPALYRHFANKKAVLAAVAEEGFRLLTQALTSAQATGAGDPLAMLRALARAYIEFAACWPGHFRSMFHVELSDKDDHPELAAESDAAVAVLMHTVKRGMAAGVFHGASAEAIFLHFWSCVHGFSELLLKKQFPTARQQDPLLLAQRIEEITELLVRGVSRGSVQSTLRNPL